MENTNLLETALWTITGIIGSGMIAVLALGWWKGNNWQREIKKKEERY